MHQTPAPTPVVPAQAAPVAPAPAPTTPSPAYNTNWPNLVIGGVVAISLLLLVGFLFWLFRGGLPQPIVKVEVPEHQVVVNVPKQEPVVNFVAQPPAVEQPPAAPVVTTCYVVHDYQLQDLPEVATSSGNFLHVEYWTDGNPERETILPGNRYLLNTALKGHVWEYSGCTFDQVMEQVDAHIARRIAQLANNDGFVPWEQVGFFEPVK